MYLEDENTLSFINHNQRKISYLSFMNKTVNRVDEIY